MADRWFKRQQRLAAAHSAARAVPEAPKAIPAPSHDEIARDLEKLAAIPDEVIRAEARKLWVEKMAAMFAVSFALMEATEIDALLARLPKGHTPGEWRAGEAGYVWADGPKGEFNVACARGWGYFTGHGTGALGMPAADATPILNANAALIALAPALATAALDLRAEVSRLTAEREQDAATIADLTRERDAAREALAATRKWIDAADQVGASGSFYYSDNVEAILELIDAAALSPTTKGGAA